VTGFVPSGAKHKKRRSRPVRLLKGVGFLLVFWLAWYYPLAHFTQVPEDFVVKLPDPDLAVFPTGSGFVKDTDEWRSKSWISFRFWGYYKQFDVAETISRPWPTDHGMETNTFDYFNDFVQTNAGWITSGRVSWVCDTSECDRGVIAVRKGRVLYRKFIMDETRARPDFFCRFVEWYSTVRERPISAAECRLRTAEHYKTDPKKWKSVRP
jgi:hypothetical protein